LEGDGSSVEGCGRKAAGSGDGGTITSLSEEPKLTTFAASVALRPAKQKQPVAISTSIHHRPSRATLLAASVFKKTIRKLGNLDGQCDGLNRDKTFIMKDLLT
jgi:hypothetical protein